ncbi:MAG: hypothetical protein IJR00_03205 [Lachnospiraceae bacterium]|nr:hypothetical protein [Lachnospiraceae bacterium]
MSRKTKIRKRIFGVTSLILAILVASIPTHSLAMLIDATPGAEFEIRRNGYSTGETEHELFKIEESTVEGLVGVDSGGSAVKKCYILTSPTTVPKATLTGILPSEQYTQTKYYDISYYAGLESTGAGTASMQYKDDDEWGTVADLKLGISQFYFVIDKPDNCDMKFAQDYGAQPQLYRLQQSVDTNGTLDSTPTYTWLTGGAGSLSTTTTGTYDTWNNIEADYTIAQVAVAYRKQLNTLEDRAYEKPANGILMAASDSPKTYGDYTVKVTDVSTGDNTGALRAFIGASEGDDYHQFNLRLMNTQNVDSTPTLIETAADGAKFCVSVALPERMPMSPNYGTYKVYRRYYDGSDYKNEEITNFAIVETGTDGRAVQFEQQFLTANAVDQAKDVNGNLLYNETSGITTTGTTPLLAPNYDIGVVFYSNGSTPQPGNTYSVTGKPASGEETYGDVQIHNNNLNTNVTNGTTNVPNDGTGSVTATASGRTVSGTTYVFDHWTATGYTLTSAQTTTDSITLSNISADTTLTAYFRPQGSSANMQSFTVTMDPTTGGTANYMGLQVRQIGTSISLTAYPESHYDFANWTYQGTSGQEVTDTNATITLPVHANLSTVTAHFTEKNYTLDIKDNRFSIDPQTQSVALSGGKLTGNTTVYVDNNVSNAAAIQTAITDAGIDNNFAVPFRIYTTPDTTGTGAQFRISNLTLPVTFNVKKGDVKVYRLDGSVLRDNLNENTDDVNGLISFDVPETGDYVFVFNINAAKLTLSYVDDRGDKTATVPWGTHTGTLPDDRYYIVRDVDSDYQTDARDNFLPAQGIVLGADNGFVEYELSLQKNPTGGTLATAVTELESIKASIPINTTYSSEEISVWRVTRALNSEGVYEYTYTPVKSGVSVTMSGNTMAIVTLDMTKPDYNGNYLIFYNRTPSLTVVETTPTVRLDTPSDEISYAKPENPLPADRFLYIRSISNSQIETLVKQDAELANYKVVPYDIYYVDAQGNRIADAEFGRMEIGLSVPTAIRGKYDLHVVGNKNGVLEKNLLSPTTQANPNVYVFVADHFSEYAFVYMDEAPSPTPSTYTVSVGTVTPAGAGTTSGGGTYSPNTTATLSANPSPGYTFQRWTDPQGNELSTNNPWTFNVTGDRTVNAVFTPSTTPGGTFSVTAIANPTAGGTVTGGGQNLAAGTNVTLTATPAQGYTVQSWIDNAVANPSTATTYTINNLDKDHSVIVEFVQSGSGGGATTGPTVTANATTEGGSASAVPNADGSWTLTANPATGYTFSGWRDPSGNIVSTANPYTFTPTANTTLTAVFTPTSQGTTPGTSNNVTVNQDTQGSTTPSSEGKSNSTDMPKTGLFDQFGTYKMIAIILLVLFGAIELLGTVNTKKQRVPVQS